MSAPVVARVTCVCPDGTLPPVIEAVAPHLFVPVGTDVTFELEFVNGDGTPRDTVQQELVTFSAAGTMDGLEFLTLVPQPDPTRANFLLVEVQASDTDGTEPAWYDYSVEWEGGGYRERVTPIGRLETTPTIGKRGAGGTARVVTKAGTVPVSGLVSAGISFARARADANYAALVSASLDANGGLSPAAWTAKTPAGFSESLTAVYEGTLDWVVAPISDGVAGSVALGGLDEVDVIFPRAVVGSYRLALAPSLDADGTIPAVGWLNKSDTGFKIRVGANFFGSVDWFLIPAAALQGTAPFVAGGVYNVVFETPRDDANYAIAFGPSVDADGGCHEVNWSNKSRYGFTIVVAAPFTGSVDWSVYVPTNP